MVRIALLLAMVALSGCSLLVTKIQNELEGRDGTQDLKFLVHRSEQILACVRKPGGRCESAANAEADALNASVSIRAPGAKAAAITALMSKVSENTIADSGLDLAKIDAAARVLRDPTSTKLERLFRKAAGLDRGLNSNLQLSRSEFSSYGKAIHEATSLESWSAFRSFVNRNKNQLEDEHQAALDSAVKQVTLIEAYLSAYFSSGRFIELVFDSANLQKSASDQISKHFGLSDDSSKDLVAKLIKELAGKTPEKDGKYYLLTKLEDGGFVTRGGTKYVFAGLSIVLDPTAEKAVQASRIDFSQVGSDVVRIFLEATADEWGQLPAESSSTACSARRAGKLANYPALLCYVEKDEQVKAAEFGKVNERASQAESLAATATGQIIRGISWISLNNESIAKLIETAVGVVARKAAEKVTWCYYACAATAAPNADAMDSTSIDSISIKFGK